MEAPDLPPPLPETTNTNRQANPKLHTVLQKRKRNTFSRHWYGECSIAASFWMALCLMGLLTIFYYPLLITAIGFVFDFDELAVLYLSFPPVMVSLAVWQVVGLYRTNRRKYQTNNSHLMYWPINCLMIIYVGYIALQVPTQYANYLDLGFKRLDGQEITASPTYTTDEYGIYIDGSITDGAAKRFQKHVGDKGRSLDTVYLNSVGGVIEEAIAIGEYIRKKRLNTVINGECSSACTLIFLYGKNRIMPTGSTLGFHASSFAGQKSTLGTGYMAVELRKRGVPETFIEKAINVDPSDMWYPSMKELYKAGVIHNKPTSINKTL